MTVLSCDSNILHAYVYNNIIGHRHNRERGAAPSVFQVCIMWIVLQRIFLVYYNHFGHQQIRI